MVSRNSMTVTCPMSSSLTKPRKRNKHTHVIEQEKWIQLYSQQQHHVMWMLTSDPSLLHTEPISSPITPPPITARRFGTDCSIRAPVESTTFWPVNVYTHNYKCKHTMSNLRYTYITHVHDGSARRLTHAPHTPRSTTLPALSTGHDGRGVTSDPTARIIFLALITWFPPAFRSTLTDVGEANFPNPFTYVTCRPSGEGRERRVAHDCEYLVLLK